MVGVDSLEVASERWRYDIVYNFTFKRGGFCSDWFAINLDCLKAAKSELFHYLSDGILGYMQLRHKVYRLAPQYAYYIAYSIAAWCRNDKVTAGFQYFAYLVKHEQRIWYVFP